MNLKKLIEKSEAFLDSAERKRKHKRKFLKQVIKKLKHHEKALKKKLQTESDPVRKAKLEQEIGLARAQRKKGLKRLKTLAKGSKSKELPSAAEDRSPASQEISPAPSQPSPPEAPDHAVSAPDHDQDPDKGPPTTP